MHIAGLQFDIAWENPAANFAKVEGLVETANLPEGTLLALPELFAVGFTMETHQLGEEPGGPTERFLAHLARKHRICVMGGVLGKTAEGRGINQSIAFSPTGAELVRYEKLQPFTLGGETAAYKAGHQPRTFDWNGARVAPYICYDLRFPEIFRPAARAGAHLYVVIANWPNMRIHHWVRLLQARAIENQAWVLGINRRGNDPKLPYSGRTLIVDPHGEIVADAGDRDSVIQHDIDLASLAEYRKLFPALSDIRSDYVPTTTS